MPITIKFFASLQQLTGIESVDIDGSDGMTATDCWKRAVGEVPIPTNTLCAINLEYARLHDRVEEDDEVAFFPPVTGG